MRIERLNSFRDKLEEPFLQNENEEIQMKIED